MEPVVRVVRLLRHMRRRGEDEKEKLRHSRQDLRRWPAVSRHAGGGGDLRCRVLPLLDRLDAMDAVFEVLRWGKQEEGEGVRAAQIWRVGRL